MEEKNIVESFFKTSAFNTSPNSLNFQGVDFERIYFDYYSNLINGYKKNIELEIGDNQSLKNCSWEPMLKAVHNGCITSFSHYLSVINNRTESGILMDLFQILQLSGFGTFQLSLPVPGSIMSISVLNSVDSFSNMQPGLEYEKNICVFTGGVVLACYNLAMGSNLGIVDEEKAAQIYENSPDIKQINNDGNDEEVIFALSME